MAELGVAASVVGVTSFGIQIAQGLLQYYGSWRHQDGNVANMCASLDSLSRTLTVLSETFQRHDPPSVSVQKGVVESVDSLNKAMKKLEDELSKLQRVDTESSKPGVRATMRRHVLRALYPFKEETLLKIQNVISEARSNLILILQVLHIESISDIRPEIKLLVRWKEDEETKSILRWLSPVNFWIKQGDVYARREPGTGEWLLEHPDFLEWERGNIEMLWCCGSPGVGKTVLASAVIQFLENDLPLPSIGLAFIYCNYKENQVQSVEYFLGAIVRQLVEQRPAIPHEVRSLYEKHRGKETNATCQEYVETLQSLAHECSEVYVAIDALDECIDKDWSIIWTKLLSILKSSIDNLRLLFTSRDIVDITGILTGSTRIEIRARRVDIEAYVQAQIRSESSLLQICEQDAEIKNKIPQAIASKAEGIFLAAQLYVKFLASKTNLRAVKKALHALPSTLDDIYEEAMNRIERSPTKPLAFKVLTWIVYAVRPLQLEEVQHAVALDELEPEDESITQDCLTLPSTIINVCAGIIRIDKESGVVSLVHKTTNEYFDRNGPNHFPHAHWDIITGSLTYLSLHVFSSGYCPSDELFEHRLKENALLDYAVQSLGDHISQGFDLSLKDLALKVFLDMQTMSSTSQVLFANRKRKWRSDYSQEFPKQFQGVHFAAYSNLTDILKLLLETGKINVNSKDEYGWTPLSRAAEKGHEAIVKLLLATGQVEVDAKDKDSWTPLSRAAEKGHEAIVKLLLATDQVEVDAKDKYSRTPLFWAASSGHKAIVKLLLATGQVEVNAKDKYSRTPLFWAASSGHEAIVKLLLATGQVEVDVKDEQGWTPLTRAAENGHEAIVKLLLATGQVDVDAKDKYGRTPLFRVVDSGHEAIVKLLLATGQVEVNAKDEDGRTALFWGANSGHEAIVKLLLATSQVEINAKDKDGETPLFWAAENGHEAIVKLLLATGQVEVDAKNEQSQTPLSWAAMNGHKAVVKLLSEYIS